MFSCTLREKRKKSNRIRWLLILMSTCLDLKVPGHLINMFLGVLLELMSVWSHRLGLRLSYVDANCHLPQSVPWKHEKNKKEEEGWIYSLVARAWTLICPQHFWFTDLHTGISSPSPLVLSLLNQTNEFSVPLACSLQTAELSTLSSINWCLHNTNMFT